MAAGWTVILERELPAPVAVGAGKSLLYYHRQIDDLAERLGLAAISGFFSRSSDDIAAYLRDQGVEPDPDQLPDEEWFDPADALATVRGLLEHLRGEPSAVPEAEKIIADLIETERALADAVAHAVRFHLGRELPKHEHE